jgi:diacylglycerol kinase
MLQDYGDELIGLLCRLPGFEVMWERKAKSLDIVYDRAFAEARALQQSILLLLLLLFFLLLLLLSSLSLLLLSFLLFPSCVLNTAVLHDQV